MRFARENKGLTADACFSDRRSKVGLRADGSPLVRLFGRDMSALRERVFRRDGNCCVECGSTQFLQSSHNRPRGAGGSDEEQNLAVRCVICHRRKDLHGEPGHF